MKLRLFLLLVVSGAGLQAATPIWWPNNGTQQDPALNYAPANLGQLKNMAKKAKLHMDATLVGGAGFSVNAMVASLGPDNGVSYTPAELAANYGPVNLGQVKAVAKPFYDRLIAAGYNTKANFAARNFPSGWAFRYPWNPSTAASANYAPANVGQLKAVFAFDLSGFDTNQDGVSDAWFAQYFTGVTGNTGPNDDYDGDGLTNLEEARRLLNPKDSDTDYDGRSDSMEIADGTDPTDASSVQPLRLAAWKFESAGFITEAGDSPSAIVDPQTNLWAATGLLGRGLNVTGKGSDASGTATSRVTYRDIEVDGRPNMNFRRGSISLWVKPSWSSGAGGTGPGGYGRIVECGTWNVSSPTGLWALHFNPDGKRLVFVTQDATSTFRNESAALDDWAANSWHHLVVTYGPTTTKLYVDNVEKISVGPQTVYPAAGIRAQGLRFGANAVGSERADVVIDQVETYNYELSPAEVAASFGSFSGLQDTDADNLPDAWETSKAGNLTALNGNGTADADGDGFSDLMEYQTGSDPMANDLNNTAKTETLGYDNANRLTTVTGKSTLSYTPDANGNLTQTAP
jgi:hypothetical protein